MGDEVITEFTGQDWAQPKVVGFYQQPKDCCNMLVNFKQIDAINQDHDDLTQYIFGGGIDAKHLIYHCDPEITFICRVYVNAGGWYSLPKAIITQVPSVPKEDWYLYLMHMNTYIDSWVSLAEVKISVPDTHRSVGITYTLDMTINVLSEDGYGDNHLQVSTFPAGGSPSGNIIYDPVITEVGQYNVSLDFVFAGTLSLRFFCPGMQLNWTIKSIFPKPAS